MRAPQRFSGGLILFVGVVAGMGLTGCGGKREPDENQAAVHLRKIVQAYNEINYRHNRSPKNVEELKPILKEMTQGGDPEVFFRSPNDGQPYEIVWGINLERVSDPNLLIAYEKKGVDGQRWGINVARIVKQYTDADLPKASPQKGK